MTALPRYKLPKGAALILRTCSAGLTSYNGFQWPKKGAVKCPDWDKRAACGNGLHGMLWGEGDAGLLDWSETALWLVVEVPLKSIVSLGRKVKFPAGKVLFVGSRHEAAGIISRFAPAGSCVIGGTATAGYRGTATAGEYGTATAGYRGALVLLYWDGRLEAYRRKCAEVGEGGIKANTPYHLEDGKFTEGKAP
jgi:hypothetical protein